MDVIFDKIISVALDVGPNVLLSLVTLAAGFYAIGWIARLLNRVFERTNFDESLESFIASFVSVGLKVILLVSVAGMLGLETTTLVAMLGAMAFAVGMALQGSLSNFAGGVLILVFKPFKVGDYIQAQGHAGKVLVIEVFQTILRTSDNKKVIIPNGELSNGSIINYSALRNRRVDMTFGIGYDDDIRAAKEILSNLVRDDERILKNPGAKIVVGNLGESSVDLYCRVWVKTDDYWDVYFDMNERVKAAFDEAGISIPFPQRDVHLINK